MPTSPSHPKTRPSSLACVECRKHRVKCDALKPACSRCVTAQIDCVFLPSRRGAKPRLGTTTQLGTNAWANTNISTVSCSETMGEKSCTDENSLPQSHHPSHLNGPSDCGNLPVRIVPEGRLLRLYYENFHSAHPILVPAPLFEEWYYPLYSSQVVKFIGSQYSVVISNDTFFESTRLILNETTDSTPQMVQALLLYSIIMRARNNPSQAKSSLCLVTDIAIEFGMYQGDFATKFSGGREYEAESLRQTWWELFSWEVFIVSLHANTDLRCADVSPMACLPCEELVYASLRSLPESKSLASFRARVFAEDEDANPFSSFAYRIEAVRILARVLVLSSLPDSQHGQLQAVANTLVSWIHHLPRQKIDIMDKYGNIYEMLFQAHFTIQYAAMLLHLPRGNLQPTFPRSMIPICPVTPVRLSPSLTRHVHDVKTIEASKRLSDLLSVRSDSRGYSPLVFGSTLCGLIQLAAIELHGPECFDHHQNRVVLILGCLRLLRSNWYLAREAHSHLRGTAARTATNFAGYSPFESTRPRIQSQGANMNIDETTASIAMLDDDLIDAFSGILAMFVDPACGNFFSQNPIPSPHFQSDAPHHILQI